MYRAEHDTNVEPIDIFECDTLGACRMFRIQPIEGFLEAHDITRKELADVIVAAVQPIGSRIGQIVYHHEDEEASS
jgi:hypothetical protein